MKEEVVARIFEEWQQITKRQIDKLYQSISRRVEAVLNQPGYRVKYRNF